MSTTSPSPCAISSTRRRMKARMRISLSSLSVCTSASRCSRSSFDHFARLDGARSDERAAAREHVDLAGELTRSMDGDERFACRRMAGQPRPDLP